MTGKSKSVEVVASISLQSTQRDKADVLEITWENKAHQFQWKHVLIGRPSALPML